MFKFVPLASLACLFATSLLGQISWKTYASLSSATSVAVGRDGAVWVATSGGLYRYDRAANQAQTFTNIEGLADIRLSAMLYDERRNELWLGAAEGALSNFNLASGRFSNFYAIANVTQFPQKRVRALALSGDSLLVATDFGVLLFSPSRREIRESYLTLGSFPTGAAVRAVLFADTLIVAGTSLGVAFASRSSPNLLAPSAWRSVPSGSVNALATFGGKIFVGTSNALLAYSLATQSFETISADSIIALRVANARLYALAKTGLLAISSGGAVERFNADFSTATSLALAPDETAFIADSRQSLLVLRHQTLSTISLNAPLRNRFEQFGIDSRGRLWVSSTIGDRGAEGFYRLDLASERWTNFPSLSAQGLNGALRQFNAFAEQGGRVYLSGWGNGFAEFISDDSVRGYSRSNVPTLLGIPANPNFIVITDFATDQKGALWMANYLSAGGALVAKLPDGSFKTFGAPNATGSNGFPQGVYAFRLTIDNFGRKWVACRTAELNTGAGVVIFDDNGTLDNLSDDKYIRLTTQSTQGALPSAKINAIKTDLDGAIWFATDEGAAYYFDASLAQAGAALPPVTRVFDLQDEVVTALAIDALNRKWFGTTNGVWLLSPDGATVLAHYTTANSPLLSNRVLAIEADKKSGKIFIGTERGLSVIQTPAVQPVAKMSTLQVFPNPARLPDQTLIEIRGLSRNAKVKIITPAGRLVRDLKSDGGAVAFWDCKDNRGELVASGVYVAVAVSENGAESAFGKIAVIRGGR
ncbi:MAG: hypothetical protein NZM06_11225 [Chloroherpetonaceae bacterium]|nr:hypothetical protein [Chloroherpetonaceae bacterium]MDW8438184.1 hypothetical protein [Chloroherpetonaceae bacterium]